MPRLSKRMREECAFFLRPKTGRPTYNLPCHKCVNDCKQSFQAEVLDLSKRAAYYAQNSSRKRGQ